MEAAAKIALLQRLVDQAEQVKIRDSDDPVFKTWKNTVERTLIRIYGQPSPEVEQFRNPGFFYHAIIMTLGTDYSHQHRQCFDRDFQILSRHYAVTSKNCRMNRPMNALSRCRFRPQPAANAPTRVFISHAAPDARFVEELIEILEMIGSRTQIFCTSFSGYGIDLGDNFLEAIKAELLNATRSVLLF